MSTKKLSGILLGVLFLVGLVSIGYAQESWPGEDEQGRLPDSVDVLEGQVQAPRSVISTQAVLTPSFTYQGRLADGGSAANGDYDFEFSLYDDLDDGGPLGSTITRTIPVTGGLFTTELDFGDSIFTGDERFLEIKVRQSGSISFTTLSPRQRLSATPYALYAIRQNRLTPADGDPTNAVFVDDDGDVGFGTTSPSLELHILDGDSPAVRLDQDSTQGWTPQVWDVAGNETNFFVRDVTHASHLPFRIMAGAPSYSIHVAADGKVGIGTSSPESKLQIEEGYLQLATSSGAPPAADCDSAAEVGRMKVDASNANLYVCTNSGWVTK